MPSKSKLKLTDLKISSFKTDHVRLKGGAQRFNSLDCKLKSILVNQCNGDTSACDMRSVDDGCESIRTHACGGCIDRYDF